MSVNRPRSCSADHATWWVMNANWSWACCMSRIRSRRRSASAKFPLNASTMARSMCAPIAMLDGRPVSASLRNSVYRSW